MPKPDFDYEAGHFAEPDYVVRAGRGQPVPKTLTCSGHGASFVIYAAEAAWVNKNLEVDGCAGFQIVDDPAKSIWARAEREALRIAQRIGCPAECPDLSPDHQSRGLTWTSTILPRARMVRSHRVEVMSWA